MGFNGLHVYDINGNNQVTADEATQIACTSSGVSAELCGPISQFETIPDSCPIAASTSDCSDRVHKNNFSSSNKTGSNYKPEISPDAAPFIPKKSIRISNINNNYACPNGNLINPD